MATISIPIGRIIYGVLADTIYIDISFLVSFLGLFILWLLIKKFII